MHVYLHIFQSVNTWHCVLRAVLCPPSVLWEVVCRLFVLRNVTRSSDTGVVCALLNVTNGSRRVRPRGILLPLRSKCCIVLM